MEPIKDMVKGKFLDSTKLVQNFVTPCKMLNAIKKNTEPIVHIAENLVGFNRRNGKRKKHMRNEHIEMPKVMAKRMYLSHVVN